MIDRTTDTETTAGQTIAEAVAAIEGEYGIEVQSVAASNADQLMQAGITVQLHITRWRATRRRSLGDLGVRLSDQGEVDAYGEFADATDLGAEKLLPVKTVRKLDAIENQARAALRRFGIKTIWGIFLPVAQIGPWLALDRSFEQAYLALRREILDNYPQIRVAAERAYRDAGAGAYRRLNNLGPDAVADPEFCYRFARARLDAFPAPGELAQSVTWGREFKFLPIPSLVAAEIAERERILTDARLTREQRDLLLSLNADLARDADAAKRAMIQGFLDDVGRELRTRILDVCADVLEAIRKNPRLPTGSVRQIRNLIEQVNNLNVLDDAAIAAQMQTLAGMVGRAGDELELAPERLARELREIRAANAAALEEIVRQAPPGRAALEDLLAPEPEPTPRPSPQMRLIDEIAELPEIARR